MGASDHGSLVEAARRARENAVARFSNFKVGAALETTDGVVITGCNVENATYGLTICAERVAMFKALSEGHRTFSRIAIVADADDPTPPCGACRQILWELPATWKSFSPTSLRRRASIASKICFRCHSTPASSENLRRPARHEATKARRFTKAETTKDSRRKSAGDAGRWCAGWIAKSQVNIWRCCHL